ncbi:MAG: Zn-ribbon domain-containing OB-fold protein [Candidatus Thermoplasmatota archaeon]|jgi:uncharacterized OB-fold protein|nr:Zn-ribbon domain-containing OB-fold protein [Candidatus Thermoplasmatota archaeon]
MSAMTKARRDTPSEEATTKAPPPVTERSSVPEQRGPGKAPPASSTPFLLDFFPLEGPDQTRLARFFERLKEGHLGTTRCPRCGALHWPPRVACPACHTEDLEWIDLPATGRIYAFSAVLAGAPLGMESDVPFAVGLVDLDGVPLRIFGRIDGRPWKELDIGDAVRVEPLDLADGRVFYRFRTVD